MILDRFKLWGAALFNGSGTNAVAAASRAAPQWMPHLGGYPGSAVMSSPNASPIPMTAAGGAVYPGSIAARIAPGLQSLGPPMCMAPEPGPVMCGAPTWMRGTGYYLTPSYTRPAVQPQRVGSPSFGLPPISSSMAAIQVMYPGA